MGWLLELLIEGIREICSQFIVDMMELVTGMFTELLSCDLMLFEELFSVVGDLYNNVVVPMGIAILFLIWAWQLFKSMFGMAGASSEDPVELVFRSCISLFFIVEARPIVNYILNIAGTPYQWVAGTEIKVENFSGFVSALEGATAPLGIGSLSIAILMLVMQFIVAWNYFKMLFVIAERYVLLGVFSYTAPLAFSTGGSKATNNILASWAKMFGGQIVLIVLNAWCMKMFLSGYGNLMASGYGFTKFFAATLCLIGFCKITFKLDSYMASLGVNLGRPSYGLGAMGLMMAVSKLLPHAGKGGSGLSGSTSEHHTESSTRSEAMGTGNMTGTSAGPIPMSFSRADGAMDRNDIRQENGFGEETDGYENGGTQSSCTLQGTESVGTLDELGVVPSDTGGIQEDSQASMGMDTDTAVKMENKEPGSDMGPALDAGSSMHMADSSSVHMSDRDSANMVDSEVAGFDENTNILPDGSTQAFCSGNVSGSGTEIETDRNGGKITEDGDQDSGDGGEMDTDTVTCQSAAISQNGKNQSGEWGAEDDDMGIIGEMGIGTGAGGQEPYNAARDVAGQYPSGGCAYMESAITGNDPIQDLENADINMQGNRGSLGISGSVPSVKGPVQGRGKMLSEVPKTRDEIRNRKR